MLTSGEPLVTYHTTVREMPTDERPRERLERHGAPSLQSAELLAIILRVGTSKENAIELASRLLRQYGGLGGLLAMDFAELCNVHGLGVAKAAQLKAALELGRRVRLPEGERPQIGSPEDIVQLVIGEMGFLSQEQLRVLCLDTKNYVVHQEVIYQGTVNGSVVRIAEVFRPAVTRTCPAIVVVHNHPSGDPTPSDEDVRTTRQLAQAGQLLDIELLDHVIVGKYRHVSLKERGLGF
ncbi:MAG: RadC family protein [Ktedonobacterales bacterium]